jgi:hypothetical protein
MTEQGDTKLPAHTAAVGSEAALEGPRDAFAANDTKPEAHYAEVGGEVRRYTAGLLREYATRALKPVALGAEQREALALLVDQVEEMQRCEHLGRPVEQRVFLLHGPGGSGQSEVIQIVRKIAERFFGPQACEVTAPSNSAARNINGDTIHSACTLNGM